MAFSAKVLADSISSVNGSRLTTFELRYPRPIHSEFMTHRALSRNAASSRAIPVEKMIRDVLEDPFIPLHWGKNQKGMQAAEVLSLEDQKRCSNIWLEARDNAVKSVRGLLELDLHKQIANRLLEPWMWITVIASGTDYAWQNFFGLRCHKDAEPHIQKIAYMALEHYRASPAKVLSIGEWHLPLIGFEGDEAYTSEIKAMISTGRSARVSYLTHEGKRDPDADIVLQNRLRDSGHWSPFEHVARVSEAPNRGGNFRDGWVQFRKMFPGECRTFEV